MSPGPKALVLIVATLAMQRVLTLPQAPDWTAAILLPMPWIVGPPLLSNNQRWYTISFFVGLVWDALFEPAIGPGAISWSCAAAVIWILSGVVVNRGSRAWFAFGSLATLVFWLVRHLSQGLLGLHLTPTPTLVLVSACASGFFCGLVGWIIRADIPQRWTTFRSRRLR